MEFLSSLMQFHLKLVEARAHSALQNGKLRGSPSRTRDSGPANPLCSPLAPDFSQDPWTASAIPHLMHQRQNQKYLESLRLMFSCSLRSKGKKLIPEKEYNSPAYQNAPKNRSAVEARMLILAATKTGRLRRLWPSLGP